MSTKAKTKRAQKRKFTLDTINAVGAYMARGMPKHYACSLVGCNEEGFDSAVKKHPEFRTALDLHHARYIDDSLSRINNGVNNWTSIAWLLERRYRPHFNRAEHVAVADVTGKAMTFSDEECKALEVAGKELVRRLSKSNGG